MTRLGMQFWGLAAILISTIAAADTGNVSSTSQSSWYDDVSKVLYLKYFGIYRGGPVTSPTNMLQPDGSGASSNLDPTSPQSLESYVTAAYKFNKDVWAGVSTHFFYTPVNVGMPNPANPASTSGPHFQMLDPSLVITKSNMYNNGEGLALKGQLFVQIPMSPYDRLSRPDSNTGLPNQMMTAIFPTYVLNWDVPNTKWSHGLYGFFGFYVPGPNTPKANLYRETKFYVAPYGSYQINDKWSATYWIDLIQATRKSQQGYFSLLGGWSNPNMDIEPGVNWEFVKGYNLNPMLNFYPETPTLRATSIQMVVSTQFF